MSEIVLFIDDLRSSDSISMCRICHEEEFESCRSLESPCACSGTVKFAHRDCVQRWCEEKGNTTCEICLQKFKPGYACPPTKKTWPIDITVTIRESLEETRNEQGRQNPGEIFQRESSECASAVDRSAAWCRSVALIFTALLLIRHLLAVILVGGDPHYPFPLVTVLIAKASGILVPMYLLIWIITSLHESIKHYSESCET